MKNYCRFADLKTLGIPWTREHIDRLQKVGKFPRKIRLAENTVVYDLAEVQTWLEERKASRSSGAAA